MALDKLQQEGAKCHIATMDGSRGYKGLITDLLTCISEENQPVCQLGNKPVFDIVYSCGPLEMMAHVAKFAKERGIPREVSLESYMACGVGVCLGCIRLRNGDASYAKVCSDGPVFSMAEVEFGAGGGRCGNES